jgi:hypothetical protein
MSTRKIRGRANTRARWFSLLGAGTLGLCIFAVDKTGEGQAPPQFVHPGIIVNRAQLDFVKAKIAAGADPWAKAFGRMQADPFYALKNYQVHPPVAKMATDKDPATTDGIVVCGSFSDPDVHCTDEKNDGVAAYTQALLWYFSGDETYAQNAINILNGWATLKKHTGFNTALQASWMGTEFARAAEIMQYLYVDSAGNAKWPADQVAAFKTMMRNTYLGDLQVGLPQNARKGDAAYGQNGNWMLSIADNLIQIGVLLDDRDVFNQGIKLWRDRTPAYCFYSVWDGAGLPQLPCGGYAGTGTGFSKTVGRTVDPYGYFGQAGGITPAADAPPADAGVDAGPPSTVSRSMPDGIAQETCRDLEHVQYGLAAMMNGAETARIQGVDLYREQADRIVACMEYHAQYLNSSPKDMSGQLIAYPTPLLSDITVTGSDPSICPNKNGKSTVKLLATGAVGAEGRDFTVQPTWEIGYNEFATRLGLSMPQTATLIQTLRSPPSPMVWIGATHHIGWETLTHGDLGSVGLSETTCGP